MAVTTASKTASNSRKSNRSPRATGDGTVHDLIRVGEVDRSTDRARFRCMRQVNQRAVNVRIQRTTNQQHNTVGSHRGTRVSRPDGYSSPPRHPALSSGFPGRLVVPTHSGDLVTRRAGLFQNSTIRVSIGVEPVWGHTLTCPRSRSKRHSHTAPVGF